MTRFPFDRYQAPFTGLTSTGLTSTGLTSLNFMFLAILGCIALAQQTHAGDWPQILGARRDGQATNEQLVAWPKSGPQKLWSYALGEGFSGPAVVGTQVIVFHRVDKDERVEALDAATGKQLWATDFDATYGGGINSDRGPRCVPVIAGNNVILFGAAGDLHCVNLKDGRKRWSKNTWQDFAAPEGYFGAGSTPLIVKDKVLVNIGGRNGAIVAFNLNTGATAWTAASGTASYSSPALAKFDKQDVAIFLTRLECVGVNPADGKIVFQFPFGQRGPTVNAATPIIDGNKFFITAAYGIGGRMMNFTGNATTAIWENDTSLSSQYSTPILHNGHLYGTHGREDFSNGELRCVAAATGKILWSDESVGVSHVIGVGDQMLVLSIDGELRHAKISKSEFAPIAKSRVSNGTTRALPALAGGRLFVRTSGQKNQLDVWLVGKQPN